MGEEEGELHAVALPINDTDAGAVPLRCEAVLQPDALAEVLSWEAVARPDALPEKLRWLAVAHPVAYRETEAAADTDAPLRDGRSDSDGLPEKLSLPLALPDVEGLPLALWDGWGGAVSPDTVAVGPADPLRRGVAVGSALLPLGEEDTVPLTLKLPPLRSSAAGD